MLQELIILFLSTLFRWKHCQTCCVTFITNSSYIQLKICKQKIEKKPIILLCNIWYTDHSSDQTEEFCVTKATSTEVCGINCYYSINY